MSTTYDNFNEKLIDKAKFDVINFSNKRCQKLTKELREKYKGKVVKCKCFDSLVAGDDYYFDQELKDIYAQADKYGNFFIMVNFMYKSIYSKPEDKAQNTTFSLESIKRAK